jgi:hypothetical protein
MVSPPSDPVPSLREARDLWSRLSRQHVSFGQGCVCGFGGLTVSMSDFELDIVEFVMNDAVRAERQDVVAALQTERPGGPRIAELLAVLESLAVSEAGTSTAAFISERVLRTLQSIEASHRRGFVCSAL